MSGALKAFATLPELPERTQRRAEALARWLASLDGSECEAMVNALFAALKAAGIGLIQNGFCIFIRGLTRAFSDVTAERNSARRDAQRKAKAE